MRLFGKFALRPFMKMANALEDIAKAMTYFAIQDARRNGAMFSLGRVNRHAVDESELLHTDDNIIRQRQQEELAQFMQRGYHPMDDAEYDDHI